MTADYLQERWDGEILMLEANSRTIHETTLNPRRISGLVFCSRLFK